MSKRKGPNKENLEQTRKVFLEIARQEFTDIGFHDATTTSIVKKSGMARGSLYYHFKDKKELFKAIYTEIMEEALDEVQHKMTAINDPWDAFIEGCRFILDLSERDDFRKIGFIQSATVLTYSERIEIQERTLLGELRRLIPPILAAGHFEGHNEQTLAVFIFGSISEIGRTLDFSTDIKKDRKIFEKSYFITLNRLKKT